jgi:tetratricopeptide (TPR) repeat protein
MGYKKWYFRKPAEALMVLSEAEAVLHLSLAKAKLNAGRLEEAEEYFAKAAEIYKELGVWENYLAGFSWAARTRVLRASDLNEAVKAAEVFEKLWKEAEGRIKPATDMFVASAILAEYLVYLAASGRKEKVAEVLREYNWLGYENYVHVAALYMLRLLGAEAEAPGAVELLKALEGRINPLLRPALAASLGVPQSSENAALQCAEVAEVPPERRRAIKIEEGGVSVDIPKLGRRAGPFAFCFGVYEAVMGDMEMLNILRMYVKELYEEGSELLSVLDRLDARGLVQISAPSDSLSRLILLLSALDEARGAEGLKREKYVELARAHALVGKYAYEETIGKTLFGEAADAVEKCGGQVENCEDLKLALLKLYYLHF